MAWGIDRQRLEHLMRLRGLRYKDLADLLGMPQRTLNDRLRGVARWRRAELERLADILDCPIGYLRGTLDEDDLCRVLARAGRKPGDVERWIGPDLTGWDIVYLYERPGRMGKWWWL